MKTQMGLERTLNALIWLQLSAVVSLIFAYNGYCWFFNTSNHVSFSFLKLLGKYYLLFYVLSSVQLAVSVKFTALRIKTNLLILTMGLSLLGVLNIIIYDKINIMVFYDEWIRRGMPDKPISDAIRRWFL